MITLSSRLTDRLSEDEKHIKENDRRVATYRRYYPNLWKRWVSSVVSEGRWHLYLTVRERNGTEIEIRESKKKDRRFKFISNVFWDVWVNGEKRGSMRTDQSWKNIKKLEERLIVHLDEKIFIYTSFAVGANTIVKTQDGKTVAEGKREKPLLGPYVMDIKEEYEPVKILLFMGFVVFNYYHRQ